MPSLGLTPKETSIILAGQQQAADALRILQYAMTQPGGVTSDDCLTALQMTHGSGSVRFSELAASRCLVSTDQKRRTRAGGLAMVHKVAHDANFGLYLRHVKGRYVRGPKGLSPRQTLILCAGETFLRQWKRVKTETSKAKALKQLVRDLLGVVDPNIQTSRKRR